MHAVNGRLALQTRVVGEVVVAITFEVGHAHLLVVPDAGDPTYDASREMFGSVAVDEVRSCALFLDGVSRRLRLGKIVFGKLSLLLDKGLYFW